jgi:SIR2-like domain
VSTEPAAAHQDLFIPGISWLERPPLFPAGANRIPLASVSGFDTAESPKLRGRFNLIKLHGSINWRGDGDSPSIVVGRRKSLAIAGDPLLSWYHWVFYRVLASGDVRLMVIGYSWGDEHINEVISHAVRERGLKLFVWDPANPLDVLPKVPNGRSIEPGIIGVASSPLSEVMPPNPAYPETPEYDRIVRTFF